MSSMEAGVSRLVFQTRLWLLDVGHSATVAKEGAATLVQHHPVRLGSSVLQATIAAWWVTLGPKPAVGLAVFAPWTAAALSLFVAFHSLHLLGSFATAADDAPPAAAPPPPAPIMQTSSAQVILALECGMAIGAGSAIFSFWLCRQKRGTGVSARSQAALPAAGDQREGQEAWPVFGGSRAEEEEERMRCGTLNDGDTDGVLCGLRQYARSVGTAVATV